VGSVAIIKGGSEQQGVNLVLQISSATFNCIGLCTKSLLKAKGELVTPLALLLYHSSLLKLMIALIF